MRKWKRQQGLYLPVNMLAEIESVAAKLDRSISWVVQFAWKLARAELARIPGVNDAPVLVRDEVRSRGDGPSPASVRVSVSQHHYRGEDERSSDQP
jgi:uncharacterized small protein (TIGR04563 family)